MATRDDVRRQICLVKPANRIIERLIACIASRQPFDKSFTNRSVLVGDAALISYLPGITPYATVCRMTKRAADLGPQLDQIGEVIGLAPQFIGDHRGLA